MLNLKYFSRKSDSIFEKMSIELCSEFNVFISTLYTGLGFFYRIWRTNTNFPQITIIN